MHNVEKKTQVLILIETSVLIGNIWIKRTKLNFVVTFGLVLKHFLSLSLELFVILSLLTKKNLNLLSIVILLEMSLSGHSMVVNQMILKLVLQGI